MQGEQEGGWSRSAGDEAWRRGENACAAPRLV